jgi:PAS domain S-box-containing protein
MGVEQTPSPGPFASGSRGVDPAEAIDLAAGHLLTGVRWDARLDEALGRLGRAARADRVVVVETNATSSTPGRGLRTWPTSSNVSLREDDVRALDAIVRSRIGSARGSRPVLLERSGAPSAEARVLRRAGIHALLAFPLAGTTAWRGYVRLDRCSPAGGWEDREIPRLAEASRHVGWAVDRWRSEADLQTSIEGYRGLVERSPAITYIHTDGEPKRILFMSPQIEDILGYPAEAWLRDEGFAWRLLHPEDRRRIERIDALGAPPVLEYRMFARDGRQVWWCDATATMKEESGETLHVGVLVDVTTLREVEYALRDDPTAPRSEPSPSVGSALLDPIERPRLRLARSARQYLRDHLGERIDRPSLARALAVSPDYLGRVFKAELGTSPHQFLIDLRLEEARRLLLMTDLSVTQIAWRLGFATVSHFVTTFRKRTGMTPLRFRRRAR